MNIKIAGIPYTVKEVGTIDEADEGVVRGKILYSNGLILLKRNQPKELKRETLIHEVVHGLFVEIGRNDLSEDETLVQSLANAIMNTKGVFEEKNNGENK